MLFGDVADAGSWSAGPAASFAKSGGQPTGWFVSLPHHSTSSSSLLSLSCSSGMGRRENKTKKEEEKEERKRRDKKNGSGTLKRVNRVIEREKKLYKYI
jgi:hypothetical protein